MTEQLEGMSLNEIEEKYDMWADNYNLDPQEVEWLFKQVKTLRKLTKTHFNRTTELSRENKRYREALEFYADKLTYTDKQHTSTGQLVGTGYITIMFDEGKKAREALKGE